MNRYLIAAALALGLSGEAQAEETKQEPKGVSLGALIDREFERATGEKPVTRTASGTVPQSPQESVRLLVEYQKTAASELEAVTTAAAIMRLDEAARKAGVALVPEGTTPVAEMLGSGAQGVFGGLDNIPGYSEATKVGASYDKTADYFVGLAGKGALRLWRHEDKGDKRLRVQFDIGNRTWNEVLTPDSANNLTRTANALKTDPESKRDMKDLEDFVYQVVKTKSGRTAILEENPVQTYTPQTVWATAALNALLKKGSIDATVSEGTDVTFWYGALSGDKPEDGVIVQIDGIAYDMPMMNVKREVEFETAYARARHDKDVKELERLAKKTNFKRQKYGSEEEIDAVKKEVALAKNDAGLIRDLAKKGKLTDSELETYLNSEQGKQVYVMIGLMGIRRDTKGVEAYGIVEGESYQARVNLAKALTSGKLKLEKARSLVERLHERRKFVKSGDEKGLRAGYVQLSTEGAERDLFDAGLVEGYNPETKKWEKVTGMWEPGIGAGLNAVTINQLEKTVVYGQAVIEPKSPEKKDK